MRRVDLWCGYWRGLLFREGFLIGLPDVNRLDLGLKLDTIARQVDLVIDDGHIPRGTRSLEGYKSLKD